MGNPNELIFLKKHLVPTSIKDEILEVGAKQVGSTSSFKDYFDGHSGYVGTDIESGEGVDVVADLLHKESMKVLDGRFGLIICCSVLEHVQNPFLAAENLTACLKDDGMIYITVPWVWRYHKYPDDYWRYSFSAIKLLFPGIDWLKQTYSTNKPDDFLTDDDENAQYHGGRKYLPYLQIHMLGRKKS